MYVVFWLFSTTREQKILQIVYFFVFLAIIVLQSLLIKPKVNKDKIQIS